MSEPTPQERIAQILAAQQAPSQQPAGLFGMPLDPNYQRNMQWANPPGPTGSYLTQLSPVEQQQFQAWVKQNNIPYDPSPRADYDMPGFWKDLMTGGGHAQSGMNANDGQMHFNDYFKTPYHMSFSNESRSAIPGAAPAWNEQDQLVAPDKRVIFDERDYVRQMRKANR